MVSVPWPDFKSPRTQKAAESNALVDAIRKTSFDDPIMISSGPIRLNEIGENVGAMTAIVQILKNRPLVVWPREMAQAPMVFPRPRA